MKSILIIGLGRFGTFMARKFSELGNHVLVLDTDEEKIDEILPYVTSAQIGDATKPAVLDAIGIDNFDLCAVCMGDPRSRRRRCSKRRAPNTCSRARPPRSRPNS